MSNRLAILVAIVLGVIAAVAVHMHVKAKEREQKEQFAMTTIIAANRTIRKGDEIRLSFGAEGMLRYREYPERAIVTGMITPTDIKRYKGFIARERIEEGAPILREKLEQDIESAESQASYIEPGMRAVTLSVDIVSGVAGLLRPGDHVDVVATFDLRGRPGAGAASNDAGSKTLFLLQNARIIALDTRTEQSAPARDSRARNYRTVTLAVSPNDAMRLANAEQQGSIKLLLRNRADTETMAATIGEGAAQRPIGWDVLNNEIKNVAPHTRAAPAE